MPYSEPIDPAQIAREWQTLEPIAIKFFAKKLAYAGINPDKGAIAANMFGRWHSQQNEPVCMEEEGDLYRLDPFMALEIWEVVADTFNLEMKPLDRSFLNYQIVKDAE